VKPQGSSVWLITGVTCLVIAMHTFADAQDLSPQWDGIQRLHVDLRDQEASPFLEFSPPQFEETILRTSFEEPARDPAPRTIAGTQASTSSATTVKPASVQRPAPNKATLNKATVDSKTATTVSDVALLNGENASARKAELREELAREGQASLSGRDNLTQEVISVAKWTVVMLVLGSVTIIGLKRFQFPASMEGASKRIRVLESLQLGRQQGLKLVEVGGERFLIASDQAGIKSVTLLPSWPALDEEETE